MACKSILTAWLIATLGARLVQAPARSTSVAYVLLAGYDFPEAILRLLQNWEIRLHVQNIPNHPSTRGLLVYEDDAFGRRWLDSHISQNCNSRI
jgi:hypothetical protein